MPKRALVAGGIGIAVSLAVLVGAAAPSRPAPPASPKAIRVADGVWFERHDDTDALGSNVAWIEFSDFGGPKTPQT